MRDPGELLVEMLNWLSFTKAAPLRVVECGTIRSPTFDGHNDGLATYHMARWVARQRMLPHEFYSFELTAGHLKACQQFLHAEGLDDYVTFGLGDADLLLEHFCQPIDLCYLDAGADPVANLSQYRRAEKWLRPPGMVVIDDVFDPRNADRGLVTVPYARLEGHKVACVDGRLALISFGVDDYPLPANSYWLEGTQAAELRAELAQIDAVLGRRPALDKSTRRENIEHAINTASRAYTAEQQRDVARAERDALKVEILAAEWAGSDAYAMPGCPFCGRDQPSDDRGDYEPHAVDCVIRKLKGTDAALGETESPRCD